MAVERLPFKILSFVDIGNGRRFNLVEPYCGTVKLTGVEPCEWVPKFESLLHGVVGGIEVCSFSTFCCCVFYYFAEILDRSFGCGDAKLHSEVVEAG